MELSGSEQSLEVTAAMYPCVMLTIVDWAGASIYSSLTNRIKFFVDNAAEYKVKSKLYFFIIHATFG